MKAPRTVGTPGTIGSDMMGNTHMVFGMASWAGAAPIVAPMVGLEMTPVAYGVGFAGVALAALLPDIDHPDSLLTRGTLPGFRKVLGPFTKPVSLFLSLPPRIVGVFVRATMGHRGPTHSLMFALLWSIIALPFYGAFAAFLVWVVSAVLSVTPAGFNPGVVWPWLSENAMTIYPMAVFVVAVGYLSHLISDGFNNVPVPYLWPFSKRRFFLFVGPLKPFRIRTQSTEEGLFRGLTVIALLAILLWTVGAPLLEEAQNRVQPSIDKIGTPKVPSPQDPQRPIR